MTHKPGKPDQGREEARSDRAARVAELLRPVRDEAVRRWLRRLLLHGDGTVAHGGKHADEA